MLSQNKQEWLKILGKGMVTLPKKWRDELGISAGDVVKARMENSKVILEPQSKNNAPYRVYSIPEINAFMKLDKLNAVLSKKVDDFLDRK